MTKTPPHPNPLPQWGRGDQRSWIVQVLRKGRVRFFSHSPTGGENFQNHHSRIELLNRSKSTVFSLSPTGGEGRGEGVFRSKCEVHGKGRGEVVFLADDVEQIGTS
jgi:hypothetical protein